MPPTEWWKARTDKVFDIGKPLSWNWVRKMPFGCIVAEDTKYAEPCDSSYGWCSAVCALRNCFMNSRGLIVKNIIWMDNNIGFEFIIY